MRQALQLILLHSALDCFPDVGFGGLDYGA
jgi:hypothetical protein